jgi:spore coat polysaccharide biosynthesis protein SpsF
MTDQEQRGRLGVVVQARMSSARCPGKVLREVAGKPLLGYVLERMARVPADVVVVATSQREDDRPVREFCRRQGVAWHAGPLEDVAARFRETVERFGLESFVRVCADSPFLDQEVVSRGVEAFRAGEWDLVTNVMPRTYPPGQSVEVVSAAAFLAAEPLFRRPEEREHVTRYFYDHAADFRLLNFTAPRDLSARPLTVDTPEDLDRCGRIVARMERPHWLYGWERVLELAAKEVERG